MPVEEGKVPRRTFLAEWFQRISCIKLLPGDAGKGGFHYLNKVFDTGNQFFARYICGRKFAHPVAHVAGVADQVTDGKAKAAG